MKFLEKLSLAIFSIIVLIISLVMCLLVFGWIKSSTILYLLQTALANPTAVNIILVISVILMLLAIKCIFFSSTAKESKEKSEGILMENENGKLLISINTIENLVKGVLSTFYSIKDSKCRVELDKQSNNVKVDLNLKVGADTVIKELSVNVQDKIKETVKQATELEIKEINIDIEDIEIEKEKNEKE